MPRLTIQNWDLTLDVPEGKSVLHAILEAGRDLEHACGGVCACSTCHVIVEAGVPNLSEKDWDEDDRLDMAEGVTLRSRLGCQARLRGDVTVRIPDKPVGAHTSGH